ncbi:histidine phosphatase superfamily [Naviculisporaceae sp. PSN 640]
MASLPAFFALAVLAGSGSAQRSSGEHVWSSVGWILHGERTPYYLPNMPTLTSLGAQQMFSQGSMFRARYMESGDFADEDEADIDRAPIVGITKNAIDNSQLDILSTNDNFISTSALAFMQGLYPPIEQAFAPNSGDMDSAVLSNGTLVNYPLGGYQYPNIRTASVQDPEAIWTEGHVGCTAYTESLLSLRNDEDVTQNYAESREFYKSMWKQLFHQDIPEQMANYYNAYGLYDYARYQFNHNNDNSTDITPSELATLATLAASEQRSRNGNLTASGATEGDMIRAIAGRTMIAKVLSWFSENIQSEGTSNKLNLAFTAIEPFVAFFSLSHLVKGPAKATFMNLPNPGAAMVFELYSVGGNSSEYPSYENLWVRFLYRNGSDPNSPLIGYPLFGNGNSQSSMLYTEFIRAVENVEIGGVSQWCNVCGSITLYCLGLRSNSDSGYPGSPAGTNPGGIRAPGGGGVSPAVAGVISAVVTAFVAGLAFLAATFLGCLSFHRRRTAPSPRASSLGGFRGAEKMASDADVAYAKSGSRHERTGSWELRDGNNKAGTSATVEEPVSPLSTVGASFEPAHLRSSIINRPENDDSISEMGLVPAKPREF